MAEHQLDPAELEPHTELWVSIVSTLAEGMLTEILRGHDSCCASTFNLALRLRGPWGELMIVHWIDTLLHRLGYSATHDPVGQARGTGTAALTFMRGSRGITEDVDDVPPMQRWAGRLVMARAALDLDTQTALLAAPPVSDPAAGDHVLGVLMLVVTTMRHHPALQGQTS